MDIDKKLKGINLPAYKIYNLAAEKKFKKKVGYITLKIDIGAFSRDISLDAREKSMEEMFDLKMEIGRQIDKVLTKEERDEKVIELISCMAALGVDEASLKLYNKDINNEALYCVKTLLNVELEMEDEENQNAPNVFN
jgi:hypothetical protein